jgi:hypothetical protein
VLDFQFDGTADVMAVICHRLAEFVNAVLHRGQQLGREADALAAIPSSFLFGSHSMVTVAHCANHCHKYFREGKA